MRKIENFNSLIKLAQNIINLAEKSGIQLRLFGSVAIAIHTKNSYHELSNDGHTRDIDFIAEYIDECRVYDFLESLHFLPEEEPKLYKSGAVRAFKTDRLFFDSDIRVEVYFGNLAFNHTIPPPYIEPLNKYTIPITQLFLSKLAIHEPKTKDIIDCCYILNDHTVDSSNDKEIIKKEKLGKYWGVGTKGWELRETCLENLLEIKKIILSNELVQFGLDNQKILTNIANLEDICISCKKSIFWYLRNLFGRKLKWYYVAEPSRP